MYLIFYTILLYKHDSQISHEVEFACGKNLVPLKCLKIKLDTDLKIILLYRQSNYKNAQAGCCNNFLQHYRYARASYIIILMAQQSYFQICI